jgi:protein SCO1/2
MKPESRHLRNSGIRWAFPLAMIAMIGWSGCSKQPAQTAQTSTASSAPTPANAKVYHLHGKVISVDPTNSSMTIDSDAIPGFMGAMAMPYTVHEKADLSKAGPGDEVNADVVVPDEGTAYIQNIVVLKKGNGAASSGPTSERDPQAGDQVPDFALLDENGKTIHLSSYRGEALLVTFVYTRCPFPDFCPLVSHNFAHIYAETKANPALREHMRLLTVSFDPDNDTPAALKKYSKTFDGTTGGNPYGRWEFAVVPKNELQKVTGFFGVTVANSNGDQIVHSMSTSVIGPDGKIYSWREDTDWKPEDLIADATAALAPAGVQTTAASLRNPGGEIPAPSRN